jgi:hypothetical protein
MIMRLIAQIVRLRTELHCKTGMVSPDFQSGCLWVLQELQKEIEKRENEQNATLCRTTVHR